MMSRSKLWFASILLLTTAPFARADFVFMVSHDVSSLIGVAAPPGPFYVEFLLNSGDGALNNTAKISGFGLLSNFGFGLAISDGNVTAVGAPVVEAGTVTGTSIDGSYLNPLTLSEDLGGITAVRQQILIDPLASSAQIRFWVESTQNFAGGTPDSFEYRFLYTDIGGDLVPINTDLPGGGFGIDLAQYFYQPNTTYQDVLAGNPVPPQNYDSNLYPGLDNLTGAHIIPEPSAFLIWGVALAGVGVYFRRRLAFGSLPSPPHASC